MGKTQTVRARIEPGLKRDAEAVLKKIGLTSSEAITLFLTQVKLNQGLPFAVRIPNKQTRAKARMLKSSRRLPLGQRRCARFDPQCGASGSSNGS
jgi:DNA-damage-inducible protein J